LNNHSTLSQALIQADMLISLATKWLSRHQMVDHLNNGSSTKKQRPSIHGEQKATLGLSKERTLWSVVPIQNGINSSNTILRNLVSITSKISESLMLMDTKMKKVTKLELPNLKTSLNSSNGRSFMLTKLKRRELKVTMSNLVWISTDHSTLFKDSQ
jgi:hypothetical protein